MRKWILLATLLLTFRLQLAPTSAKAQMETKPFLHPLFTDNMVLQRGVPAPVWGWTTPGAKVTVTVAGKTAAATADAAGKWLAKLSPLPVGGPYTLKVTGPQSLTRNNVLVGDVWICSGQSNMEMGIGNVYDAQKEIADANYPEIRLFSVPKSTAFAPKETLSGTWDVCTPQTVAANGWGGFTAVGYFFGRTLYKELKIPVGLIHSSWGGTIAEAWVSGPTLKRSVADFTSAVAQVETMASAPKVEDFNRAVAEWYPKNDPGTAANWGAADFDASAWKTMNLPIAWEQAGLPDFDGIVWFRKEITLPDSSAGKEAVLHLGPIDDLDVTWVNGTQVGATGVYNSDRNYKVPVGLLKAGKNVIAVRVMDTGGNGGIYGKPEQLALEIGGESLALKGDWSYQVGVALNKATPFPVQTANNPNVATVLYNGMIAPLVPFGIKGAIWYQGESNAGRDEQYRRLLPALIKDWREQFGVGPFPFYIVQLANFMAQDTEPKDDAWPRLREAQYLTSAHVLNAGLAVAIDIGDANDIHPKNKQEVGRRLALDALAKTYGKKVEYSGPIYKSMKIEGDKIRLNFDHLGGGLAVKDGDMLKGFAIAGEDRKFVWANAKIEGDTVVVSAPQVTKPTAVHYAWSNNPVCNLYNKANLPAVPFRTEGPAPMQTTKK